MNEECSLIPICLFFLLREKHFFKIWPLYEIPNAVIYDITKKFVVLTLSITKKLFNTLNVIER